MINPISRFLFPLVIAGLLFSISSCRWNPDTVQPDLRLDFESLIRTPVFMEPNPSGIAPLTAMATFQTVRPMKVRMRVLGPDPAEKTFPGFNNQHSIPILGLYPGTNNQIEITLTDKYFFFAIDTFSLQTAPLPDYYPQIIVTQKNLAAMEPGWNLSGLSFGKDGIFITHPIMFDHSGIVRWNLELDTLGGWTSPIRRLRNGNLLTGRKGHLYEFDMLGNVIQTWDLPGYIQHHEVIEKPDGNFIAGVDKIGIPTIEDHVIEIDRESGNIVQVWDLRQILDMSRFDLIQDAMDWFHLNAIHYSAYDDCLIISGRNQGVIKVTRDNQLKWILAPHKGWGKAGPNGNGFETSDYLLTALDETGNPFPDSIQDGLTDPSSFSWVWGQHAPVLLENGNLFVFDNGFARNFIQPPVDPFSRAVEYEINENAMTVRQVWQYGKARGMECFSPIISDVDELPETGNRLFMPGIILNTGQPQARIVEVSFPDKQVVFESEIHFKNKFGNGQLLWGQFDLIYRSERLSLYPD
jgi:arylsulfate sulfotransferase